MSTINNTNYNCTVCDQSIVPNSHEHDHCVLVNNGYDLICQYCPFVCKTKCDNCVICEEAQIDPSESESEDPPTVKPSRFSNSALDDMNVWCHECAKCEGWFAPCEHDMVCYSDHMSNPDVKCDCKCPNGC